MKQSDVVIGQTYHYKRSGKLLKVRVTLNFNQAYRAIDLETGKNIYISSARKLRPIE